MPLYDYKCKKCGRLQELPFSIHNYPQVVKCDKCKGGKARKVILGIAMQDDALAPWMRDIVGGPGKPGGIIDNRLVAAGKIPPITSRKEFVAQLRKKNVVLMHPSEIR